ncbi:MAG TPA: hypothetical protein VM911_02520 [Pyrinomonadaceae bacterium]|jgi:hypothetical protein|nr:hypothetical protein [Pyrinomonadaceae bacterium]
MPRLTVRIAVALLTFTIGVTVTFWLMRRRSTEQAQIPAHSVPPLIQRASEPPARSENVCDDVPLPEVEKVYISYPLEKINRVWYNAHIIFFYKNGDWVRLWDEVRREGDKFIISPPDGFHDEVGTWKKEDNGVITISIERRSCHMCGLPLGYQKPDYPITERWLSKGLILGHTDVSHRRYRQIREDQIFHDLDEGVSAWDIRRSLSPCLIRYSPNGTGEDY